MLELGAHLGGQMQGRDASHPPTRAVETSGGERRGDQSARIQDLRQAVGGAGRWDEDSLDTSTGGSMCARPVLHSCRVAAIPLEGRPDQTEDVPMSGLPVLPRRVQQVAGPKLPPLPEPNR